MTFDMSRVVIWKLLLVNLSLNMVKYTSCLACLAGALMAYTNDATVVTNPLLIEDLPRMVLFGIGYR